VSLMRRGVGGGDGAPPLLCVVVEEGRVAAIDARRGRYGGCVGGQRSK
jgi:hypothetical protein